MVWQEMMFADALYPRDMVSAVLINTNGNHLGKFQ